MGTKKGTDIYIGSRGKHDTKAESGIDNDTQCEEKSQVSIYIDAINKKK